MVAVAKVDEIKLLVDRRGSSFAEGSFVCTPDSRRGDGKMEKTYLGLSSYNMEAACH